MHPRRIAKTATTIMIRPIFIRGVRIAGSCKSRSLDHLFLGPAIVTRRPVRANYNSPEAVTGEVGEGLVERLRHKRFTPPGGAWRRYYAFRPCWGRRIG